MAGLDVGGEGSVTFEEWMAGTARFAKCGRDGGVARFAFLALDTGREGAVRHAAPERL